MNSTILNLTPNIRTIEQTNQGLVEPDLAIKQQIMDFSNVNGVAFNSEDELQQELTSRARKVAGLVANQYPQYNTVMIGDTAFDGYLEQELTYRGIKSVKSFKQFFIEGAAGATGGEQSNRVEKHVAFVASAYWTAYQRAQSVGNNGTLLGEALNSCDNTVIKGIE